MKAASIFSTGIIIFFAQFAAATQCGDLIYNKNGKFRKYEYVNNTGIENTKKHGSSTTVQVTTEGSTASVDPGVSTGVSQSHSQSTSTRGECKWGGFFVSHNDYKEYLAQNMHEIKNQMAKGQGGHLEILASAFTCDESGKKALSKVLQKNFGEFVDYEPANAAEFAASLKHVVEGTPALHCQSI